MSVLPALDQSVLRVTSARFPSLVLSVLGSVVSMFGSIGIYAGSLNNEWLQAPVIIGIFLCGVVGLVCGVWVHSSTMRTGGSLSGVERVLAGVSVVMGSLAVGVVLMIVAVLSLMAFISAR